MPDGETAILNTNILEASSLGDDSNTELKYKLITDAAGGTLVATLDVSPSVINGIVYQMFVVTVNTINGGSDESYTINNSNSNITLVPATAVLQLNKQTYVANSGKNYPQIMAQLVNYTILYNSGVVSNSYPSGSQINEIVHSVKAGGSPNNTFFVFACVPTSDSIIVNITGNQSGAIGTFTIAGISLVKL